MTRQEHLLAVLAEEAVEVAQRATKALRFGLFEVQESQDRTNAQRIQFEFADLQALMEMLGLADIPREAVEAKKAKVETFLAYSEQCGTLQEDSEL